MYNIDDILRLIDCRSTQEEQQKGIVLAREVKCIKTFFQPSGPGYNKSVWENCARIVSERTDEELIPYTIDMLMWLQDLNWPGAELILLRLKNFSDFTIISLIIKDMVSALNAIDEASWLMSIAELLDNPNFEKAIDDISKKILVKYKRDTQ